MKKAYSLPRYKALNFESNINALVRLAKGNICDVNVLNSFKFFHLNTNNLCLQLISTTNYRRRANLPCKNRIWIVIDFLDK